MLEYYVFHKYIVVGNDSFWNIELVISKLYSPQLLCIYIQQYTFNSTFDKVERQIFEPWCSGQGSATLSIETHNVAEYLNLNWICWCRNSIQQICYEWMQMRASSIFGCMHLCNVCLVYTTKLCSFHPGKTIVANMRRFVTDMVASVFRELA